MITIFNDNNVSNDNIMSNVIGHIIINDDYFNKVSFQNTYLFNSLFLSLSLSLSLSFSLSLFLSLSLCLSFSLSLSNILTQVSSFMSKEGIQKRDNKQAKALLASQLT